MTIDRNILGHRGCESKKLDGKCSSGPFSRTQRENVLKEATMATKKKAAKKSAKKKK
jgi:hypothetical protein